jgi:hypothetical protein
MHEISLHKLSNYKVGWSIPIINKLREEDMLFKTACTQLDADYETFFFFFEEIRELRNELFAHDLKPRNLNHFKSGSGYL